MGRFFAILYSELTYGIAAKKIELLSETMDAVHRIGSMSGKMTGFKSDGIYEDLRIAPSSWAFPDFGMYNQAWLALLFLQLL